MKIEILKDVDIDIKSNKAIEGLILDHNGLIFHEPTLNRLFSSYHKTELYYYLVWKNQKLIALCPFHRVKKKHTELLYSGMGSIGIPYGGWIFNESEIKLQELLNSTPIKFNQALNYFSNIAIDPIEIDGVEKKEHTTALVNLSHDLDDIFSSSIHSKRRNMIRKAGKNDIEIKSFGEEGIDMFYPIILEMSKKAGFGLLDKSFYQQMLNYYSPHKQAFIIMAFQNNEPVSGVFLLGNHNVMHYYQGASNMNYKNFGQGDLLQWEAIKLSHKMQAGYYDLCVIEKERLPEIARFKLGFSNSLYPFYTFSKKSFSFRLLNKLQK